MHQPATAGCASGVAVSLRVHGQHPQGVLQTLQALRRPDARHPTNRLDIQRPPVEARIAHADAKWPVSTIPTPDRQLMSAAGSTDQAAHRMLLCWLL